MTTERNAAIATAASPVCTRAITPDDSIPHMCGLQEWMPIGETNFSGTHSRLYTAGNGSSTRGENSEKRAIDALRRQRELPQGLLVDVMTFRTSAPRTQDDITLCASEEETGRKPSRPAPAEAHAGCGTQSRNGYARDRHRRQAPRAQNAGLCSGARVNAAARAAQLPPGEVPYRGHRAVGV